MVPENAQEGQDIGTEDTPVNPVGATDPDVKAETEPDTVKDTNPNTNANDDLIYTLTGSDARFFDIDKTKPAG